MDIRGKYEEAKRGVLDELIGYQIRRAQTRLFAHFQSQLEQLRITPGQFGLLILIAENPGITQVALARAVGIERATLGEFIDRFEGERERGRHRNGRGDLPYARDQRVVPFRNVQCLRLRCGYDEDPVHLLPPCSTADDTAVCMRVASSRTVSRGRLAARLR